MITSALGLQSIEIVVPVALPRFPIVVPVALPRLQIVVPVALPRLQIVVPVAQGHLGGQQKGTVLNRSFLENGSIGVFHIPDALPAPPVWWLEPYKRSFHRYRPSPVPGSHPVRRERGPVELLPLPFPQV